MFFTGLYMSKPSRTEVAYDSNRINNSINKPNEEIKKSLKMDTRNVKFYHTGIINSCSSINTKI